MLTRYAERVFEHFNFSSGANIEVLENKKIQQLYISGKMKFTTLFTFFFVAFIFTMLKIVSQIRITNWNGYYDNNNHYIVYKKIMHI